MNRFVSVALGCAVGVCSFGAVATPTATPGPSPSAAAFADPPQAFLPRTWMHAMCGNLSKEGFTKDFEAMAEAGIGGALVFHIDRGIPCGPTAFGSEAFNEVLVHAALEADRVGIEMGLHNCDGWSSSGGPWVTPEQSMKRVVSASTVAVSEGGRQRLPLPAVSRSRSFSRDIAVLAWPASPAERALAAQRETLKASDPRAELSNLRDGNLDTHATVRGRRGESVWIEASYPEPVSIGSIHLEQRSREGEGALWVSQDGETFTEVGPLTKHRIGKNHWAFEESFSEGVRGRHFRVVFDRSFPVRVFELSARPRSRDWQVRNAMASATPRPNEDFPAEAVLDPDSIRVLRQGDLDGDAIEVELPAGAWTVTRYGFTTTGAFNNPASSAGRGLEIDKLDAAAIDHHFAQYVGKVVRAAQARGSNALVYSEIDSYEMGGNNWTAGFAEDFENRWGYPLLPWLPTLLGHVVEGPQATDAVLTDVRGRVAELMTENYFRRFAELCREHGMKAYVEPYGFGTLNELSVGGTADKTMGEFWVVENGFEGIFDAAVSSARIYGKNVVSAESFTAWQEVNWRGHPFSMKVFGDHAWASGINETMFHRFAHQPNTHVVPGMTMGSVGSHIDRTQTWWPNAGKAWFRYLARGSYLLQQGVPSSDFLVFGGDATPERVPRRERVGLPAGFNGDFVNADVLIHRVKVVDGQLVLPEGTRYRALVLHRADRLRMATLERLGELVREGALVVGPPPVGPIGRREQLEEADAFAALVAELWQTDVAGTGPRALGGGAVIPVADPAAAMRHLGLGPDLALNGRGAKHFTHRSLQDGELYFFFNEEKAWANLELDFRVSGLSPEVWDADSGRVEALAADAVVDARGRTRFRLAVEPHGSRFVFFRRPGSASPATLASSRPGTTGKLALLETLGRSAAPATPETPAAANDNAAAAADNSAADRAAEAREAPEVLPLALPWRADFDPAWGGPGEIDLPDLGDWAEHEDGRVRHHSGTVAYTASFEAEAAWAEHPGPVVLDLGEVRIAAVVTLNDERFEPLWKPPFALDVRPALRTGRNDLRIEVTNVWTNRLIGDQAHPANDGYDPRGTMPAWFSNNQPPPPSKRFTWTAWNFYRNPAQQKLEPSGLWGPVRLVKRGG